MISDLCFVIHVLSCLYSMGLLMQYLFRGTENTPCAGDIMNFGNVLERHYGEHQTLSQEAER